MTTEDQEANDLNVAARKFMQQIIEQHSEAVAKCAEAIAKANIVMQATHNYAVDKKVDPEVCETLRDAHAGYIEFILQAYVDALKLSAEQLEHVKSAADGLVKTIYDQNAKAADRD